MTRLLLADDSELIRSRLSNVLRLIPGVEEVGTTDSLDQTLHVVSNSPPDFVILDLNFSDGRVLDMIWSLKRLAPLMGIVVLSNDASPYVGERCRKAGATWFFDKSTELEKVLALVEYFPIQV